MYRQLNFLIKLNSLLAALKKEDKEYYEKIHEKAKVKQKYNHIFGSDDRLFIEDDRLKNFQIVDLQPLVLKNETIDYADDIGFLNEMLVDKIFDDEVKKYVISSSDYIAGYFVEIDNNNNPTGRKIKFNSVVDKILKNIDLRINDIDSSIDNDVLSESSEQYLISELLSYKKYKEKVEKIKKNFISYRPTKAISDKDFYIVISRAAEDIAGMSTDRRWTSCMRLPGYGDKNGGLYNDRLYYDVKLGTLVAYLITKDDRNIENPLARIAIKPLFNLDDDIADILDALDIQSTEYLSKDNLKAIKDFKKKKITVFLRPEENIYSDGSLSTEIKTNFKRIVNDFCEKNNKNVEGMYFLNRRLYNDSAKESEFTLKNKNHKEYINNLITNLKDNDEILNDFSINLEKSLLEWYFYNNKDINNWFFKALKDNNIKYISLIDYKGLKASFLKNANVEDKKLNLILDVCENCNFKNVKYITIYEESRNCTFETCTIICGKYKNCSFINCEFSQNIDVFSEKYKDFVRCAVNTEQFLQAEKYSSSLEDLRNTIKRKLLK